MITHRTPAQRPGRPVLARVAIRGFGAGLVLGVAVLLPLLAQPALADTPVGWSTPPHVSALDYLLVLLLIPGGIAILISLLVALPSMIKGDSYQPGEAWRGDDEWFGGPGKGVEGAAAPAADDSERGGAGAQF